MPTETIKHISYQNLSTFAAQLKAKYAKKTDVTAVSDRVTSLENVGAQANVLEGVKVNGAALTITEKAVDIAVPVKVSDLANDSKFQTESEVAAAVAAADHLKRRIVASVDAIDKTSGDAARYIYMVLKGTTKSGDKYDEYMVIDGEVERVGDWTVDLSGYQPVEEGKGLSTEDYSTEDKTKLEGIATGATKVEASETNGNVKINGVEQTVYTLPDTVLHTSDLETVTEAEILALFAEQEA